MKQINTDELQTIDLSLIGDNLPESASVLRPALWQDGDEYCALLGPDPQEGVFGCGPTPQQAIQDWDLHLQERRAVHKPGDEVVAYVEEKLAAGFK